MPYGYYGLWFSRYSANTGFTSFNIPESGAGYAIPAYNLNSRTGLLGSGVVVDNGNQLEDIKNQLTALTTAVKAIPTTITASASSSSSGGSAPVTVVTPQEAPIFTVIAGESFNLPCNKYDDMQSASANGITVTNTTVGDGCIMVSGKINTEGTYTLSVKGKSFIFYVVKEPNSANVLVKLD